MGAGSCWRGINGIITICHNLKIILFVSYCYIAEIVNIYYGKYKIPDMTGLGNEFAPEALEKAVIKVIVE